MFEFGSWQPGVFFVCTFVPCPADKVQEFTFPSVIDLGVEDCRDFIFAFAVDFDRRWRRLGTIRNGVRGCGFQLGNMEDWVDFAEMVRKPQGDRMSTRPGDDVERSKTFLC